MDRRKNWMTKWKKKKLGGANAQGGDGDGKKRDSKVVYKKAVSCGARSVGLVSVRAPR
jgi:hypothetical protein